MIMTKTTFFSSWIVLISVLLPCLKLKSSIAASFLPPTRKLPYYSSSVVFFKTQNNIFVHNNRRRTFSALQMRDASSATWFNVGDKVRVVDNVTKAGSNLINKVGIVVETWEKCDVDPTCCCAEQVDLGMAVHVKFLVDDCIVLDKKGDDDDDDDDYFVHYFAEEELERVKEGEEEKEEEEEEKEKELSKPVAVVSGASLSQTTTATATTTTIPFDGLSCKEFKLDQLKMGAQAQRIAAFEKSKREEEEEKDDR